jgi:hypothetical protein
VPGLGQSLVGLRWVNAEKRDALKIDLPLDEAILAVLEIPPEPQKPKRRRVKARGDP